MVERLKRVPLREVWRNEAIDFTPWLEENADILTETLAFAVSSVEREKQVGDFSVDVVAEDESGELVVIENQLERSDHDHLGKLITYLSVVGARRGVWIVSDPRPEHVRAVSWLNESSAADFYLVKAEAVVIGDSKPAPLLTLIVGPSEEIKIGGQKREELAGRHAVRLRFWRGLLERARPRTKLHGSISPSKENYLGASAGIPGLSYAYLIRQRDSDVVLYIWRGKDSKAENERIFDKLLQHKDQIDAAFGTALDWERLEQRDVCRIKHTLTSGGSQSEENWPEIQDDMIDAMIRLEAAFRPHLVNLDV